MLPSGVLQRWHGNSGESLWDVKKIRPSKIQIGKHVTCVHLTMDHRGQHIHTRKINMSMFAGQIHRTSFFFVLVRQLNRSQAFVDKSTQIAKLVSKSHWLLRYTYHEPPSSDCIYVHQLSHDKSAINAMNPSFWGWISMFQCVRSRKRAIKDLHP